MDLKLARERIGDRVRELRENAGLSQAAFAKRVGLTQRAVSAIERGLFSPSVESVLKIATAFEVSPGEILDIAPRARDEKRSAIEALNVYLRSRAEDDVRRVHLVALSMLEPLPGTKRRGRPRRQ